ncbi:MAG: hypothetical protein QJR03_13585 [Sphaerobacter sp.]|nr:hypothetical protein [Sphaerobacter sp.]
MTAVVRRQVGGYLVLTAVAAAQYLIVRGRAVEDAWFYLFGAVLFAVLAVASVVQVAVRGPEAIVREMDERAAWLDAKATRVAYSVSIIAAYLVAFQQALATGQAFNPVTYLFGFMGGIWGVAWTIVHWRYR